MPALLLLVLCACRHTPAPISEPVPEATPAPAEVTPAPPSRGLPVPSSWSSPACEGREYERRIAFSAGRFEAHDLVSPCPGDKLCVWSGIITRGGSWTLDRRQVRLTVEPAAEPSRFPFPEQLWLAEDGALTEDEGRCPYARVE